MLTNYKEVFEIFDFLEDDQSYFAKREGLKTLHEVLCKFPELKELYVKDKEHLIRIMKEIVNESKGI
jgi:hypothetical protein